MNPASGDFFGVAASAIPVKLYGAASTHNTKFTIKSGVKREGGQMASVRLLVIYPRTKDLPLSNGSTRRSISPWPPKRYLARSNS